MLYFSLSSFSCLSSLCIFITIVLNSICDSLLSSTSFSCFTGESFIPLNCGFFLWLYILGDSFCLFLWFLMFCFSSCLRRVNFCGRISVGLSGVVSLISLSGCSKVALSSVCVGSHFVPGLYQLMAPLLVGSPLQQVYWYSQLPPCLVWDQVQGKGEIE